MNPVTLGDPEMSTKTVTLKAPHRHAGRDYPAGASITLRTEQADWLVANGRAEHKPAEPAEPKPAEPAKKAKA